MPEKCPICKKLVNYSLIPVFDTACCYDCLSPELQKAYDTVFGREVQNEPVRADCEPEDEFRRYRPDYVNYEPKIDRETRLNANGKQDLFE